MATSNKYDRQLRIWGSSGQKALAETTVVLVRATAAGTETIKNLVLPGIGQIVVFDDCVDIKEQYKSNFFLTKSSNNNPKCKCRAEIALEHLQELNPDVQGKWRHFDTDLMRVDLAQELLSLSSSSSGGGAVVATGTAASGDAASSKNKKRLLVIGSDLEFPLLEKLSTVCQAQSIPFIQVHSYGLMGIVRLQCPLLPIINSKPRSSPPDLRLVNKPFPQLQQLANSIGDLNQLDNKEHGHVPYPLLLLQFIQQWKDSHNGNAPQTFSEKQEFQQFIKSKSRNYDMELNFQEAVQNAYTVYSTKTVDTDHLNTLYQRSHRNNNLNMNPNLQQFHKLLDALNKFLQSHDQQPPLSGGAIPDMTSSTELYIQLQNVYREQAHVELNEMKQLLLQQQSGANIAIPDELLTTFCQNVHHLDSLDTGTIVDEYNNTSTKDNDLCQDLIMAIMEVDDEAAEVKGQLPLLWYLGYRACQQFYKFHGRYPGTIDDDYNKDIELLQKYIVDMVELYKLSDNELMKNTLSSMKDQYNKYATELCRYGNAEIHNIASVIGGVASQEAVKLITEQYVPINNTYVYNGIASIGSVYRMF